MSAPRWSQRARADLKAIHDYIAKDSPANAKAVVRDILERATMLPDTPRIGRRVPELDDPEIREVPAHSWRVIYQLRGDEVFIVTLVHRRRAPTPEELRR
ncbi:MAG: type II toxin-antitoxin system RelE/ParE family toxin [Gammaproteobacteria bacterium]|nr:type II toxin-antitoxin system RelE/ParE family toxin [Gammaproteobacteria bacterium]